MLTKININYNNQDPVLNFFNENVSPKDFKIKFKDYTNTSFSVLHLNIRSLSKNFESFEELYLLSFKFNIVCFSETLSKEEKVNENSLYQQLEGYNLLHQNRKYENGGGAAIFVNSIQDARGREGGSPGTSTNVKISPSNSLILRFNHFVTLV